MSLALFDHRCTDVTCPVKHVATSKSIAVILMHLLHCNVIDVSIKSFQTKTQIVTKLTGHDFSLFYNFLSVAVWFGKNA